MQRVEVSQVDKTSDLRVTHLTMMRATRKKAMNLGVRIVMANSVASLGRSASGLSAHHCRLWEIAGQLYAPECRHAEVQDEPGEHKTPSMRVGALAERYLGSKIEV